ncbi:MAG: TIGR04219 family outer membrane beta-barrel protein [Pseudomonadales bacterium]
MRHSLIYAGLVCAISSTTMADTIGFEVGAYSWQENFSGDVTSGVLGTNVDVENDLGYSDESNNVFYVVLEHPIPLVPNLRIQQTDMDLSATGNATFQFGNITFSGPITSSIDLSHTDFTLYYEILDNWISLDVGITARSINDGSISITDNTTGLTDDFDADGVIPLLYVATRFDLPLSGLYVGADLNGLSVGDSSLIDYRVNLGYESSIGLGVEAGFRSFELDYDDDDDDADLTIDGAYVGIFYHF